MTERRPTDTDAPGAAPDDQAGAPRASDTIRMDAAAVRAADAEDERRRAAAADEADDDDGDGNDPDDGAEPALVDESAFDDVDDDDDDEDMPGHFSLVANPEDVASIPEGERPPPEPEGPPEIPLDLIDKDALWVVRRLHAKGFEAYLTGGCVRDLLLGRAPKDFDVATAAHPNQCKAVFRNCRLVGRRFRLAHVFFPSGKVIETATFRANPTDELDDLPNDLLVDRDNVFGNVEQDAFRRDLTINGLFYDPLKGKVLDFCDGRKDLDARLIRTIGNPEVRFQEDPVRIIRAIKFATRLGFNIEDATFAAMKSHVGGLLRCAPARLQEEMLRLLTSGHAEASMRLCEEVGVTSTILPELEDVFIREFEPAAVSVAVPVTLADSSDSGDAPVDGGRAILPTDEQAAQAPSAVDAERALGDASAAVSPDASAPTAAQMDDVTAPVRLERPRFRYETRMLTVPSMSERRARFFGLLASLDEARRRDFDITSALALSVLLTPAFEAFGASTQAFPLWFVETADKWTERLRLTRHDRERIPQILEMQEELLPARRRPATARGVTSRPSFKEALALYTLRLHQQQQPLDDVGMWKAVAASFGAPYRQMRLTERGPRQRATGRADGGGGGGSGGGGRGGRDRGRGRSRRRR